jgi:hypothetical protein
MLVIWNFLFHTKLVQKEEHKALCLQLEFGPITLKLRLFKMKFRMRIFVNYAEKTIIFIIFYQN